MNEKQKFLNRYLDTCLDEILKEIKRCYSKDGDIDIYIYIEDGEVEVDITHYENTENKKLVMHFPPSETTGYDMEDMSQIALDDFDKLRDFIKSKGDNVETILDVFSYSNLDYAIEKVIPHMHKDKAEVVRTIIFDDYYREPLIKAFYETVKEF